MEKVIDVTDKRLVSTNGESFISRTWSWLAWRELTDKFSKIKVAYDGMPRGSQSIRKQHGGQCPYCKDMLEINDEHYGNIYCLCYLLDFYYDLRSDVSVYQSYTQEASLSNLTTNHVRGDQIATRTLSKAIEVVYKWLANPEKWLVITGNPGVGKTHILRAIAHTLPEISLYITSADFSQHVYAETAENNLQGMLKSVRRVPVLLFDDWGTEHGTNFGQAQFRSIIDYRYNLWREYPTVVTSNMNADQMAAYDPRVASRLLDTEKSIHLPIISQDYRRAKNNGK